MPALARAAPLRRRRVSLDELLQRARGDLIGDPRRALNTANEAVALADARGDLSERADARQVRGEARRFLGQHEAALVDYSHAGEVYRRLRRPGDAARSDASAVDSLRCLGRPTQALRLAARARRIFNRLGEELRAAVLDEMIGLVYMQQNDFARALRLFDRARPIVGAVGHPLDLATLNNNAATTLTNLDRLREAETLYAAARSAYAQQGTAPALARVDANLGYLALRQGRYGAAVDLLRGAADVFDSLRNVPLAIATRLDLADAYLALNLLDEAGALSHEQLRLAEEVGLDNEHARALFYLSTQRGRLGLIQDALDGLVQAEEEFAAQDNLVWRTRCVLARAPLLLARGEPSDVKEAVALSRRAARVFARLALPSRQAVAHAMLARAYLRARRGRAAGEEARAAVWLAQSLGVPWLLFECLYILGRALRARGEADSAYVTYHEATRQLERVRAELHPEELRISLVSDKTDVYQELVLLCLERGSAEEALQYAEQAKSRAFAERLSSSVDTLRSHGTAHLVGTTDAGVLERMQQLRDELVWLYSRLTEGEANSTIEKLRRKVASCESELIRLQRRLQPASRAQAAALGMGGVETRDAASRSRLRRRLEPGTVVLEYFQAGEELVVFLFDAIRLTAYRLGPAEGVFELVDRFRFQVGKFALGDAYVRDHADALLSGVNHILANLYAALIDPVADELVDVRRLIVVPHGALHHLPFQALLDPGGTPLVERVEIASAPSASVLASCYQRAALPAGLGARLLVGVADPAIPQVGIEIDALARMFGQSLVLSGEAATEQAFRRHAPEADVIHLASHAVFRQDNPLFSAVRLADGWLSLYDLYGMRLRAGLVTLSACETGVGDVLAGDELVGLARGFFQAGAAAVVVSLWAVNDASTARLMQRFYAHLESGRAVAAAMRLAQIEQRRELPHPYFWAPFVVIGRP
ncbi:MAG: CHAT domain-containing protein [Chloroflexi bacterium]|nr:MAG: CHAT domain-containing protein [Chloroflexota bacterium]